MNSESTLNLPPLPSLKWDEYFWTGSIMLASWAGFQSRQGWYNSIDEAGVSDGSVTLMIHTPDDEPTMPSEEQIAAYQVLIDQQVTIRDALIQAILPNILPGVSNTWKAMIC